MTDGAATAEWLGVFDISLVRRLVSHRALANALALGLRYSREPVVVSETVHAQLEHAGPAGARPSGPFDVAVRATADGGALLGDCSHCVPTFGACVHMTTLAVDLALSVPMRDALLEDASTREQAARAPALRHGKHLELAFEGGLQAWLAPIAEGLRVQIAASPFMPIDAVGRAYGERAEPSRARVLSIFVRRVGERKLLTAAEMRALRDFSPRDRRVLAHVQDRGPARKASYASGVQASLAIEAMRAHGGVFAAGFKGLLDFRAALARPSVMHTPAVGDPPFDTLSALWLVDGSGTRIAFGESVFFGAPFPCVWTESGAIYRVAPDVDLDFVAQLAELPSLRVPPGKLRDAGARLLRAARGRGVVMPAHETFGLAPVETARFVLRVAGEPLDVQAELFAVYRAGEVALSRGARLPNDEGRDVEAEVRALSRVRGVGLERDREGDEGERHEPADEAEEERDELLHARGETAVHFWQEGLLALRGSEDPHIEIELAERLARVRVGAPLSGRVHVALEGDWLDTRVEFASKELPVELDAIREALHRKQRWVALDDGTLARISDSIEALADEAADVLKSKARARLPAHQLGRLDRWIEENDGRMDAAIASMRRRLRALAVAAEPEMPRGLNATLRGYQRLGLAWLQFLQALGAGGILADDMGLGKTITTLAFLLRRKETEGAAPSLVVCPTSVATNWARESARFTPDLRVLMLHGLSQGARANARMRAQIAESDVVVTTYALLRRDLDELAKMPFRCVVLDEAQNVKNADSATRRAAGLLDATMRIALTGTPIENRLRELWSLASFANPGILGTSRAFETRYERPIAADRQSPLAAELRAVVRPFLLRRTKDEVLRELPPKTEVDRFVTMSQADKRMYDALAHTLRASIRQNVEKRGMSAATLSVFTALTRLRQMSCDPRLVDARLPADRSAKREAFLDLVRELVAEGRRALVFSQFVSLLTLWRRDLDAEGIAYEYLDGATTKRDEVVTRFQEGAAPLFLISLKAGGAGLNLTAADTVIHCDPWWNPAVEDQATDRAYRIGQDKPVTVVRLVARGTIEEKILSLKDKKRELTGAILGGDAGASALRGLTEDDIRALLGDADDRSDDDGQDDHDDDDGAPTDTLATSSRVLHPDYDSVVAQARRWLRETGRAESELAEVTGIPVPFASRLARGEPFPCSRAVGERIAERLRAWR